MQSDDALSLEAQATKLRDEDKFKQAALVWEKLLGQIPDWEHGTGFYDLGYIYLELGEDQKALECFRKAMIFMPESDYFHEAFARVATSVGDPYEALESFKFVFSNPSWKNYTLEMKQELNELLVILANKLGMAYDQLVDQLSLDADRIEF